MLRDGRVRPVRRWLAGANHLSWAMGALYMAGAACFAVGPVPPFADAVGTSATATVFFVGSIFFTSAEYLQFYEVLRAPEGVADSRTGPRRLMGLRLHQIDWWTAVVLLVGTISFNIDTLAATFSSERVIEQEVFVWIPDLVGCVCFLVSSAGAFAEVSPRRWPSLRRGTGWLIALLNLLGSVAFIASAIGAFVVPSDGRDLSSPLAAVGTFAGAVLFFAAAALLPVESSRDRAAA